MRGVPGAALHVRLALVLLGLFVVAGVACLSLVYWATEQHHQEATQYLNRDLGMYIAQREPLIRDGVVNEPAMAELAHQAMVINPIVEVYLLDTEGRILAHTLPAETVRRGRVDLTPVRAFVAGRQDFPIRGDDPRDLSGTAVFSAFPVTDDGRRAGYVYAVLGARQYESLPQSLQASYILRNSLGAVVAIVLFGFSSLLVAFRLLTRPLRRLASEVEAFQRDELGQQAPGGRRGDEIDTLRRAFTAMKQRIHEQLGELRETDQARRELVSNVSHDLRTPLASMQGYLETLLYKPMSEEERAHHLSVVHRHCLRLGRLVSELFELSKLDLGMVSPCPEPFALPELLQDVQQKFELTAQRRHVSMTLEVAGPVAPVLADIAMIERVLENLIDNALQHTPRHGRIDLRISVSQGRARVTVRDSGDGIEAAELPHIFERYYRGRRRPVGDGEDGGTGLGLAIVRRMLELHDASLDVVSAPGRGSTFTFTLPLAGGRTVTEAERGVDAPVSAGGR